MEVVYFYPRAMPDATTDFGEERGALAPAQTPCQLVRFLCIVRASPEH